MTFRIVNTDHSDCVLAAGVAGKTKVVSCRSPADAASPVTLHAGDHTRPLGQSADYRHHLDGLMSIHGAALVRSWWDNDAQQWYTTIDGIDQAEAAVRDFILARQRERDAKADTDNRARAEAARQKAVQTEKSRMADVMALCRQAAEQWMPGRVAVKMANDQEIIVGRWDEPYIPGHGLPAEVRRVVRGEGGQPKLAECRESYRYTFV